MSFDTPIETDEREISVKMDIFGQSEYTMYSESLFRETMFNIVQKRTKNGVDA